MANRATGIECVLWPAVVRALAPLVVAFPLAAQSIVEQTTYVKPTQIWPEAEFGFSVDADGDTLVVGARTSQGIGAAFVFREGPGGWVQEALLVQSYPDFSDYFGWRVAVDGDTVAVGAPFEDGATQGINGDEQAVGGPAGAGSGAVYVFRRTGSVWQQEAYIKASNAGGNDNFGTSLVLDGERLFVGARRESLSSHDSTPTVGVLGSSRGAAYEFQRTGTTWSEVAFIRPPMPTGAEGFGGGIDVDGNTLVLGATQEPDPSYPTSASDDAGSVRVYERVGSTWVLQAFLRPAAVENMGSFGTDVDVDEAAGLLVVGAQGGGTLFRGSGSISVFARNGTQWQELDSVVCPAELSLWVVPGIFMGYSVAIEGDTIVAGAWGESGNSSGIDGPYTSTSAGDDSGAVFHYRLEQGQLQLASYIKASNAEPGAQFGRGVALVGERLFVGAPGETGGDNQIDGDQSPTGTQRGAAYIFDLDGPDAAAVVRTAGANPLSFSSTPPALGTTWQGTVDLTTTGHPFAALAFFLRPTRTNLGLSNQWLLAGPNFPAGEISGLAPAAGPTATFALGIPPLTVLMGRELYAQAFHFGGGQPVACSNALDLRLGN